MSGSTAMMCPAIAEIRLLPFFVILSDRQALKRGIRG